MEISHRALEPTEVEDRSITVIFFKHEKKEKIEVGSIKSGIEKIKNEDTLK